MLAAIRSGAADQAERLIRKIMTDSRDEVLGKMGQMGLTQADTVDAFRRQVY